MVSCCQTFQGHEGVAGGRKGLGVGAFNRRFPASRGSGKVQHGQDAGKSLRRFNQRLTKYTGKLVLSSEVSPHLAPCVFRAEWRDRKQQRPQEEGGGRRRRGPLGEPPPPPPAPPPSARARVCAEPASARTRRPAALTEGGARGSSGPAAELDWAWGRRCSSSEGLQPGGGGACGS